VIRTLWTALVATAVTLFWGPPVLVNAMLRRKPGTWYVDVTRSWARAIFWASGCRAEVEGVENLRAGEAQVVVANHVSWFDVFALASILEVPYHFVAKKELERIPLFGPAWKAAGHISIDRSDRERAIASLRAAGAQIRREGSAVVIFPEGTRSRSGRLQTFKKGAFQLARESGAPVVPAVVTGSFEIMPPGSWRIRPRTVHIRFLPAVLPQVYGSTEALMGEVHSAMLRVLLAERGITR
jgi:1-acyl-sn-glycerol-3-phosphate acyltransferase